MFSGLICIFMIVCARFRLRYLHLKGLLTKKKIIVTEEDFSTKGCTCTHMGIDIDMV